MSDRYHTLFARLESHGAAALIPFVTLGDPDLVGSARILDDVVEAGVDALELGIPFSDPVADGPVLQAAATRALAQGVSVSDCFALVRRVRSRAPAIPIGLLVYANTVVARGIEPFYRDAADAGVDSVLVADVPLDEGAPFDAAAAQVGIAPIYIAAPNITAARTAELAGRTRGYTYVTSRPGVTGDRGPRGDVTLERRIAALGAAGAPPAVVGFGISTADDVRHAVAAGARGVIVGSALVQRIVDEGAVPVGYLRELVAATRTRAVVA